MLCATTDIPNGMHVQLLGDVRGNIVFSKHIGRDIMAGVKSIAGGEIKSYTDMTNEARAEAQRRMIVEAQNVGADAVFCMRFSSETVVQGTTEMLCYGTAVKFLQ